MAHLTAEEFVDLAEGTRSAGSLPHLASCAGCRAQVDALRDTIASVGVIEAPEPSPMFWDHFSARVRDAVGQEPSAVWSWVRVGWGWRLAVAAIGVLVVAVGIRSRIGDERAAPPAASRADATLEGPGAADDASLALVADLLADVDWEVAGDASLVRGGADVGAEAVSVLSEDERRELRRLLQDALSPGRRGA